MRQPVPVSSNRVTVTASNRVTVTASVRVTVSVRIRSVGVGQSVRVDQS